MSGSDEIDVAIAQEVARLDELDRLRGEVRQRIERLRERSPAVPATVEPDWTAERKLDDYVDAELPVLRRMFAKRLKAYRTLGYELAESP